MARAEEEEERERGGEREREGDTVNVSSLRHSLLGIELTLSNLLLIKIKWS